ncbi:MAG: hypothetical protein HY319_10255 [Armatimonadetes bacterium]|nr:hypothetical protein [Armatimonadota bacterium]
MAFPIGFPQQQHYQPYQPYQPYQQYQQPYGFSPSSPHAYGHTQGIGFPNFPELRELHDSFRALHGGWSAFGGRSHEAHRGGGRGYVDFDVHQNTYRLPGGGRGVHSYGQIGFGWNAQQAGHGIFGGAGRLASSLVPLPGFPLPFALFS